MYGLQEPPESWKVCKLNVIFKKGDATLPKNYRPISIIPVMSKVFSTLIYLRIQGAIDGQLSDEQYGFRRGRGCSDAVHVLRMVVEKSAEWGEELWVAALDVEKAFDRVHHTALFDCLMDACIGWEVLSSLRRLYSGMRAYVSISPGTDSRAFNIERGVRQGDPLSPLLFNLVMKRVLQDVREVWDRRGYGTNVGQRLSGQRLTHCAFADDMTLMARSWTSMKRMLSMVQKSLTSFGLTLHPSKCKVQTNRGTNFPRGATNIEEGFEWKFSLRMQAFLYWALFYFWMTRPNVRSSTELQQVGGCFWE